MRTDLPTDAEPVRVIKGEALAVLPELPAATFDLILNDPPYSSGGFTRSDRQQEVSQKYQQSGTRRRYPSFAGDGRDQRSYAYWSALWLGQCLRVSKPGAICGVFTDWRPIQGRPTNACEFLVWGTNGPRPLRGCPFPGHFTHPVKQADKHHLTGKPTALMRDLVQLAPEGGLVLDCFGGSGTTGAAAVMEGRRCVLIESEPAYAEIARQRAAEAVSGRR